MDSLFHATELQGSAAEVSNRNEAPGALSAAVVTIVHQHDLALGELRLVLFRKFARRSGDTSG